MIIGIPLERASNEKRVALSPTSIPGAINLGLEVHVESSAGSAAGFSDADYRDLGAVIVDSTDRLYQDCDVIIKVRAPLTEADGGLDELSLLGSGKTLISLIGPGQNPVLLKALAQRGVTTLAMDAVPRTVSYTHLTLPTILLV